MATRLRRGLSPPPPTSLLSSLRSLCGLRARARLEKEEEGKKRKENPWIPPSSLPFLSLPLSLSSDEARSDATYERATEPHSLSLSSLLSLFGAVRYYYNYTKESPLFLPPSLPSAGAEGGRPREGETRSQPLKRTGGVFENLARFAREGGERRRGEGRGAVCVVVIALLAAQKSRRGREEGERRRRRRNALEAWMESRTQQESIFRLSPGGFSADTLKAVYILWNLVFVSLFYLFIKWGFVGGSTGG